MTGPSRTIDVRGEELVITRHFDAPRDLVFKAFAEVDHMARWWGPQGFEIAVSRFEFRPGGIFHYSMTGSDGHAMWGRMVYREIVAPERIAWVTSFSDEAGGLTRAPFDGMWPLQMLNTVTLAEHDGKTTLTIRVRALDATDEEVATFEGGFDSMRRGYGGTFDQLADFLASQPATA